MTLVTRATACLAGAGVAVAMLWAPSAAADDPAEPLTTLLGALLGQQPPDDAPPVRQSGDDGRTSAPDRILRSGCRNYPYRYRITTPSSDWTLETFLRDRDGEGVASGTFLSDSDPRQGNARFRLCRYATKPGRFTIRALVHWYGDGGQEHRSWLEPSHFRLSRQR